MVARNSKDARPQSNDPRHLVNAKIKLAGTPMGDVTVKEVIVGESLLNPSVHCAVTLQSVVYTPMSKESSFFNTFQGKNWDQYKETDMELEITDQEYQSDSPRIMKIKQKIYRCDNRRFTNLNTGQVEDLTLHTVDESILKDAGMIMEQKSWKCTTPSTIVREALQAIGAPTDYVENAGPAKDYVAESIHPLQVIQQQANMALYNGDDPSFLHYMTIQESTGRNLHHFTPLGRLIEGDASHTIYANDTAITGGSSFSDAYNTAITFSFPCDYDLLSDRLNGVGPQGQNMNAFNGFNLVSGAFSAAGALMHGDLSGVSNLFSGMSNKGTAQQQNSCESKIDEYLTKRQARLGLLEKDKIALRITVPWSPWLHVGNVFHFHWGNRYDDTMKIYGTGDYLIVHLTHNIQFGGYATTTLDCIANTYGGNRRNGL